MSDPFVTCVMLTGGKGREWWAQRAYRAFAAQERYFNRELLVVNESGGTDWEYRMLPADGGASAGVKVREIVLPYRKHTIGQLRNIGKAEASGDWILQWDDDDWSHPERIYDQMRFREEGCCQVLFAQIRYSMPTNTAYMYSNPGTGIAGTILHPKTDFLYPAQMTGEDSLFLLGAWGDGRLRVLDNYVRPHLYIRFFHGDNLSHAQQVMRKYAEAKWAHRWVDLPEQWGWMSRHATSYLLSVLAEHYDVHSQRTPWIDVLGNRKKSHITDNDTIQGIRQEQE